MIIKRISNDNSVLIAGEVFEVVYALDNEEQIDDSWMIDEEAVLSEKDESHVFFNLLMGIESQLIDVDVVRLDSYGNLFVGSLIEVWSSYEEQELDDKEITDIAFSSDSTIEDLLESLLGIQPSVSNVDVVRIDSNMNYLAPEITESHEF